MCKKFFKICSKNRLTLKKVVLKIMSCSKQLTRNALRNRMIVIKENYTYVTE